MLPAVVEIVPEFCSRGVVRLIDAADIVLPPATLIELPGSAPEAAVSVVPAVASPKKETPVPAVIPIEFVAFSAPVRETTTAVPPDNVRSVPVMFCRVSRPPVVTSETLPVAVALPTARVPAAVVIDMSDPEALTAPAIWLADTEMLPPLKLTTSPVTKVPVPDAAVMSPAEVKLNVMSAPAPPAPVKDEAAPRFSVRAFPAPLLCTARFPAVALMVPLLFNVGVLMETDAPEAKIPAPTVTDEPTPPPELAISDAPETLALRATLPPATNPVEAEPVTVPFMVMLPGAVSKRLPVALSAPLVVVLPPSESITKTPVEENAPMFRLPEAVSIEIPLVVPVIVPLMELKSSRIPPVPPLNTTVSAATMSPLAPTGSAMAPAFVPLKITSAPPAVAESSDPAPGVRFSAKPAPLL